MRDPNRIDRVLDLLRQYWTQYPDMRLGQIVVCAIRPKEPCPQVFFAEDDVTEAGLRHALVPAPTIRGPDHSEPRRGDGA